VSIGSLSIILHAHLPFVRHPECEDFLEEDWLYEAVTETYIPLLRVFERLMREGERFHITMSLTPPLCEMLADPLLQGRYTNYVSKLIDLCDRELDRHREGSPFRSSVRMYDRELRAALELFRRCGGNLVGAFRRMQDAGFLEIMTCTATHAILPLVLTEEAKRAQIRLAVSNYRKHFGRDPRGIWLAECAYAPGIDALLAEAGLRYFVADTHGVLLGNPLPRFGVYAPVCTPAGLAAFARDVESSRQVWSSVEGYPGDPDYREFYRDLGYDGEYEHVRPFLHSDGVRRNLGMKYHRITGNVDLSGKEPYDPDAAEAKAAEHADNFIANRRTQVSHLRAVLGREPLVVSPYDAELFGHWWYEGPRFLYHLVKKLNHDQDEVRLVSPQQYLDENPLLQGVQPSSSTWGDKGYFEFWLNGSNDWIYKHLHEAEIRMAQLARRFQNAEGLTARALNQAARELVLAQSSDWAFIMTAGTVVSYAHKRTRDHVARFNGLYLQITEDRIEPEWLARLEWLDNIFPEMDYHVYVGG